MRIERPGLVAWMSQFAQGNAREIAGAIAIFVFSVVASMAVVVVFVCRLPEGYLQQEGKDLSSQKDRPAWQRVALGIGKNLLGVLLVALGIVLSLPGIPGQGLLTILIGLMLLDIPGKQRLERRLLRRPAIFRSINALRGRFGRPPLLPALDP